MKTEITVTLDDRERLERLIADRNTAAHVLHIPFRQAPLKHAIKTFDHDNLPLGGGLGIYSWESYVQWGLVERSA